MNILGYVKKYGNYTFQEITFSTVDALICATLSYLNFELYSHSFNEEIIIKDIEDTNIIKLCAGELTTKFNEKLIKQLKISRRYKDVVIKYIKNVHNKTDTIQFFAMTLFIPYYYPIVVFRGTDLTLIGWKEDLMLATNKVVPSHIEAFNYIDEVSKKIDGVFSIAGHSKGGNIALFSALHCHKNVQDRIKNIYSFDGPGFSDQNVFRTQKYLNIKDRIIQIIPPDDVVGAILYTPEHSLVVKASGVGFFQHNPYYWKILPNGEFKYISEQKNVVKIRHLALISWLQKINQEDKNLLIDVIINFFGGVDYSLIEYFHHIPRSIKRYIVLRKKYSKEEKLKIKNAWKLLSSCYKEAKNALKNY